jgi:hypothetical protein
VSFRLAAGSGGTVVIDTRPHSIPGVVPLALGLHAVSFQHDGHETHQMIYVGAEAPKEYVFDSVSEKVHAFD